MNFENERRRMVERQLVKRGIRDPDVLAAMARVPREAFVPRESHAFSYADGPLPIGFGQTISQPYIVALMTEALGLDPSHRVLEVGTGCGYQTAILAELAREVYSLERVPELASRAAEALAGLGYANVFAQEGDGFVGWPEAAPFDRIILTCAPTVVPQALVGQLDDGGCLVAPVGGEGDVQRLSRFRKAPAGLEEELLAPVRFVPMVAGRTPPGGRPD